VATASRRSLAVARPTYASSRATVVSHGRQHHRASLMRASAVIEENRTFRVAVPATPSLPSEPIRLSALDALRSLLLAPCHGVALWSFSF
jgi:hypothetical protein